MILDQIFLDDSGNIGNTAMQDPGFLRVRELLTRLIKHNGGNPYVGRDMKRLLLGAGYEILELGASYSNYTTPASVSRFAESSAGMLRNSPTADQLVELGWVAQEELERAADLFLSWAKKPESFHARAYVHGIGRRI